MDINNYLNDLFSQRQEKFAIVKNQEYMDWFVNLIDNSENGIVDDVTLKYSNNESDYNNGSLLSYFQSYIEQLAKEQLIPEKEFEEDNSFPIVGYNFKLNDNYYEVSTVFGQGAETLIRKLSTEPTLYVDILADKPNPDMELIQYIIVNKDLNMSTGKIAAQVGHVCTECAVKLKDTSKFNIWYNNEQKKIILEAHQSVLEKLEQNNKFFSIRDNGHTEISANSLTAISLGILSRKEALPIIKRLQTLKDKI